MFHKIFFPQLVVQPSCKHFVLCALPKTTVICLSIFLLGSVPTTTPALASAITSLTTLFVIWLCLPQKGISRFISIALSDLHTSATYVVFFFEHFVVKQVTFLLVISIRFKRHKSKPPRTSRLLVSHDSNIDNFTIVLHIAFDVVLSR